MRADHCFTASVGMMLWIPVWVSASAVTGHADTLHLRAWIDGRSQIVLQGATAQWNHFDFAAPGRLDCDTGATIEPTYLGEAVWFPQWPDASTCENRFCDCSSDVFTGLVPSLPSSSFDASLQLVQARGPCDIVEFPTSANGYRVVIEFNDNGWGAADWYELDLVMLPSNSGTAFCFGDGLDAAHTTPCPCGNTGASGHGCGNSVNAAGGLLEGSGNAGVDDIVLMASGMPLSVACIFLQGDGLSDVVLNDGVRCVGGNLMRLRMRNNVNGASSFPDATDSVTLSHRGGVTIGSGAVRHYQAYYRNAAVTFCPSGVSNLTNGWSIVW